MATTIRLTRMGRKKRPFYRLVVLDSRKRRDGAYLANLGYYNPFCDPHEVELHAPEIIDWLGKGATLSETARSLLKAEGLLYQFSLVQAGLGQDEIAAKMTEWRAGSESRKQARVEAAAAKAEAARRALQEKEKAEAEAKAAEEAAEKAAAEKAAAEEAAAEKAAAEGAAAAEAADAGEAEEPAAEAAAEEKKDAGEDGEA